MLGQLFFNLRTKCAAAFSKEEALGTRFLFYPVFSGAGAVVYFLFGYEPSFVDCFLFVFLCCGFYYLARHWWFAHIIALFLLCFSLGFLSAKVETMRAQTVMLGSDVATELTGQVISFEKMTNGRVRMLLDVQMTARPELFYMPQRVRLSARSVPDNLRIGDVVRGRALLRAASGPVRPGNYDFSFHNYFRGVGAQGFFLSVPVQIDVVTTSSIWSKMEIAVARLRAHMTRRITRAIPGEEGAIAAALITGQRGGISPQSNDALRIAGLSHILSISGLHMAMVTGMALVAIRSFLALFPVWSSLFNAKKVAAFIALFVSGFYLLLSGSDVAAQRSFVMVAVMLIAVLLNRSAITMHNLAIAALITIAFVPHEIVGPSFQMSFAATAALIAAFGWWAKRRAQRKLKQGVPSFVGGGVMRLTLFPLISTAVASIVAGGASGIYSAYQFSNTAPLGVVSNAVSFPVMSIFVMPFALIAAVFMPFGFEWVPLQIMGWGVKLVLDIAFWITSISPDFNPGFINNRSLTVLSIGLIILLFMQTRLRFSGAVLLLLGLMMVILQKPPSVVISEDGKLAAAMIGPGEMAVSRTRSNQFVLKNWREAYRVTRLFLPQAKAGERGFACTVDECRIQLESGKIFAIIATRKDLKNVCQNIDIAFLDFIGADKTRCPGKIVITRKDLALFGTVEINDEGDTRWSIGKPLRPWNAQRIFSHQARGF